MNVVYSKLVDDNDYFISKTLLPELLCLSINTSEAADGIF